MEQYWKKLISMALHVFIENGQNDAVFVIRHGEPELTINAYDNWNGGITYLDLRFRLRYSDYKKIESNKSEIEEQIQTTLESFHSYDNEQIANVLIEPLVEQFYDWASIYPHTKQSVINAIESEFEMLEKIAVGELSFKEDEVESTYRKRHSFIIQVSEKVGFSYPITTNTLSEWWSEIKQYNTYADRRSYLSQLLFSVKQELENSDDIKIRIDFSQIASKSDTIRKAINDSEMFLREGKYDSAVDRIHTAFHGYLRALLSDHGVPFDSEDIPALFSKLHNFYGNTIQPPDVAERIKKILRSGGGMITAINELRNNNTVVHPNDNLINKREAELVIRLVNAITDYVESIEKNLQE